MSNTKTNNDTPSDSNVNDSETPASTPAAQQLIERVSDILTVRAAYVASDLIYATLNYATWSDYEDFPLVVPDDAALLVLIVDAPEGLAGEFEIVKE